MKIPLLLVKDYIPPKYFCEILGDLSLSEKTWYQVMYYHESLILLDDFMIFSNTNELPMTVKNRAIICIGTPNECVLKNNLCLCFLETENPMKIFTIIQEIFLKFENWQDKLQKALIKNKTIQQIFEIGYEVFDNSMFIHDKDFYRLAYVAQSSIEPAWDYIEESKMYKLPLALLNDFKINRDYLDSMFTSKPSIFPEGTFDYRILYQNLWYQGRYIGRICINELSRRIRESDSWLLNYFSEIVLESFKKWESPANSYSDTLSYLLTELLKGESVDKKSMDRTLMFYDWTISDDYFCACLFLKENDSQINSISYLQATFQNALPHACVFQYQNNIVILINRTVSDLTIAGFQNQIALLLREGLMEAGISSIGSDLSKFKYYYQQAVSAYETGKRKQGTFWSYCFDDYRTDVILHNALATFPAEFLCQKEIFLLERYDTENGAEFSKTLRTYLEQDRNIARASEILDIHRTTLLYRIGRIEKLTQLQLEDSEIRFSLLLSYHLLYESRGHL